MPWVRLPSGQQYADRRPDVPGVENDSWGEDRLLARQGQERFLLQAGYVDRLVGELVRTLRRRGLYDRSLLVITADHGVSFQPGRPRRQITPETLPDIAPVPLFVKLPGQRAGRVDDRMARTVDIVPTIADQLKIRLDDPWTVTPCFALLAAPAGHRLGRRTPRRSRFRSPSSSASETVRLVA